MKISVITVSFNSESTINDTLRSVACQDYGDFEYIIVDGGSTDATLEICGHYDWLITHCYSEPDDGIYDAMNKGVSFASGDVIGILNSDDFYLDKNVFSEVAGFFNADPELDVLLGDVDFVNDVDLSHPVRRYSTGYFWPWMFRFGLMPPHPAVFVRKSAYDRVGLYKLGYKIAADFDLLTRLLLLGGAKYQASKKTWVRMRTGGTSTSGLKSNLIATLEMKRSLKENGLFACYVMLMCRLPLKLFTQVLLK